MLIERFDGKPVLVTVFLAALLGSERKKQN